MNHFQNRLELLRIVYVASSINFILALRLSDVNITLIDIKGIKAWTFFIAFPDTLVYSIVL